MKFISVEVSEDSFIRQYLFSFLDKYFEYGELCLRDSSGKIVEDQEVVDEFYTLKYDLSENYSDDDLIKYVCIFATNRVIDMIEALKKENLSC